MPAEAIKAANVEQILPLDGIYAAIEKRVIQICRATPVGAK
jgi:chemotaxis response regulator CheB